MFHLRDGALKEGSDVAMRRETSVFEGWFSVWREI